MSVYNDDKGQVRRWRLGSMPTEFAVTIEQYEPPTRVSIEVHADSRVASGIFTEGLDAEPSWKDEANCLGVDPDLFFPERGESTKQAKSVCAGCVVRDECLEYAIVNVEKFGIWGGKSERERRLLRRERALKQAAAL
jgi:WhiB family redox-sensing transcriptional regulator